MFSFINKKFIIILTELFIVKPWCIASITVAKDNLTSVGFRTIEDVDQTIFKELVIPQLLNAAKDYGIKSMLLSAQLNL